MDLRRSAHIVALADEGSFNAAAERVHLSQPAFSRSIQAAEDELGMPLFDRAFKPIRCTPAGAFVVDRLRRLLQASTNLQQEIAMFRDGLVGKLHFGMGTFNAMHFLPSLLADMRQHCPGIRLLAVVQHPALLLEQVRRHELEFAVVDRRYVSADLDAEPLPSLPAHFYVRAGHPLLTRKSVRIEHLAQYGLATGQLARALQGALKRAMGLGEADELPLAVQCDDASALKAVTLATDVVMPAIPKMLEAEIASGVLRPLAVVGVPASFESQPAIVSECGRAFTPAATYAAQYLRRNAHARGPGT